SRSTTCRGPSEAATDAPFFRADQCGGGVWGRSGAAFPQDYADQCGGGVWGRSGAAFPQDYADQCGGGVWGRSSAAPLKDTLMAPIVEIDRVVKRFGGVTAVNNVSLSLDAGRIYGLIGPNGSGKTTLFNCITGVDRADEGQVRFKGKRIEGLKPHQIFH